MAICLWYVSYSVCTQGVTISTFFSVQTCLVTPVLLDSTFVSPFSHGSWRGGSKSRCEIYACVACTAQQVSHLAVLLFLLPLPCIVGCDYTVKCIVLFPTFSSYSFPSHFRRVLRQSPPPATDIHESSCTLPRGRLANF